MAAARIASPAVIPFRVRSIPLEPIHLSGFSIRLSQNACQIDAARLYGAARPITGRAFHHLAKQRPAIGKAVDAPHQSFSELPFSHVAA